MHQVSDAVGLRKLPSVYVSRSAGVPISLGLLRPAIVLPEPMLSEADQAALRAVLLHEMAHIARHDSWVGVGSVLRRCCSGGIRGSTGFGRISDLREEICDNHVVLVQGEGRQLARILVDLAARTTTGPLLPSTVGVMETRLAGLTGASAGY